MDMRKITEGYFVSPQISAEDVADLASAGIALVICNRPDGEVPPSHQADSIGAAVRDAGIAFEALPITHQTMTPDVVARQAELVAQAGGPVLAYCASGTRSTVIWALGQAKTMDTQSILDAAAQGGYELSGLRPTLDALAKG